MRPRGSVRWGIALMVVLALYRVAFPSLMDAGASAGGWGIGAAMLLAGFGLALVFSAIYDGPRALVRLLRRSRADR